MLPDQCRAARALLSWTIDHLASEAGVNRATIIKFETGQSKPHRATLHVLRTTLETGGVEFIENGRGPGVRRLVKKPD
ncbi:MAG: helix-turn-helix transcriptional regulator [Myxococcales bacterium]|nr:helix-turn-helix transcriptional regulator [Myxococcales bacterium]